MARIPLITQRTGALTGPQTEAFDWVVHSRGAMIRPFEVLLHSPAVARHAAELGAQIRFESVAVGPRPRAGHHHDRAHPRLRVRVGQSPTAR